MSSPPELHDLACVIHLHSVYSDGTGTVPEIAAAARRTGADVVLLTDHDTLAAKDRGEEGWHDGVLVLVGEEITPAGGNHFLAFGIDRKIDHRGLDARGICLAVRAAGGFGFAAHPFSRGSPRFKRAPVMAFDDLECEALGGIEVWSFANDIGEGIESIPQLVHFLARPGRVLAHPPEGNLSEWDRLCRERRVVGIGGIDAHQYGKRIGRFVPVRVMAYHRSFRHLRTHVLLDGPLSPEPVDAREQVYAALRAGGCYIAVDSLGEARGFSFWAEGPDGHVRMGAEAPAGRYTLHATLPGPARVRLLRDGREVAVVDGSELSHELDGPGVVRVEANRMNHGRDRTWVLSNPIYLRS